jgi:hypothetical protein
MSSQAGAQLNGIKCVGLLPPLSSSAYTRCITAHWPCSDVVYSVISYYAPLGKQAHSFLLAPDMRAPAE